MTSINPEVPMFDPIDYKSQTWQNWLKNLPAADQALVAPMAFDIVLDLPSDKFDRRAKLRQDYMIIQRAEQSLQKSRDKAAQQARTIELTEDLTKEIKFGDIAAILSSTIKKDDAPKLITFCGMLLAQTEDDQFNVGFQQQSAAGKSYIPLEVSVYFPKEEVKRIGGATPTAFTHEQGNWDDQRKAVIVDLEGKILIFLDMPDYRLLEKLRPLLAHDWKEIEYKITDKSERRGLRTKTVIVRGYPSVFFCTTKTDPDEQEKTRLILLSPSTDQAKIDEALKLIALKKGNFDKYRKEILQDPARLWLANRIKAVRQTGIRQVVLPEDGTSLYRQFKEDHPYLLARHQRDFPRIISLVKAHAFLNCFHREQVINGHADQPKEILATQADIDAGLALYKEIESSNELGLSPYIYSIYEQVIKPLLDADVGIKRKELRRKFYSIFHKTLPEKQESSILSQLEAASLITQEPDPDDRRQNLIYPTHPGDISAPALKVEETRQ